MGEFTKPMYEEVDWQVVADAGLFLIINQFLHLAGYALVREEVDGKIIRVYVAKCKFRGFDEQTTTDGYKRFTQHMAERMPELLEDVKE